MVDFAPRDAARVPRLTRAHLVLAYSAFAAMLSGCVGELVVGARNPPGSPILIDVTPANGSANVAFFAPNDDGGAPISTFTAICTPAGGLPTTANGLSSPIAVTGLTNGTQYTCYVTATNGLGTSGPSIVATVIPAGTPDAPTVGTATFTSGTAIVTFTPPASDNGGVITSYTGTCSATGQQSRTGVSTTSPVSVGSLTNGVTYLCNVKATNSVGAGPASGDVSVTPIGSPTAPLGVAGTGGNSQASLAFTAPTNNGGSPITGYAAACTFSGTTFTASGTTSPVVVTGLANGRTYVCSLTATNGIGTSVASTSATVVVGVVPGAPTIGAVTPGNASATVAYTYTAPAADSVNPATFTATCTATGVATRTGTGASPITVTSMVNGTTYLCNVKASNVAGTGSASADASVRPVGPPGPPIILTALAGDAQATISFNPPASDGGSTVTGYTATCVAGSSSVPASGASSPIVVTGLTNGTLVSCSVKATNAIGTGTASNNLSVTPRTVPGAPTIGVPTAANTNVKIAFTAPASNGGSTITSYTATCTAAGQTTRTATGTASPLTVTNVVNFVQYACSVVATNVAGSGTPSAAANVTPTNLGLGTSTLCGYGYNQVNSAIINAGGTIYTSTVNYSCTASTRTMTMNQIPDHPAIAKDTATSGGNPNKMTTQSVPSAVSFTLNPNAIGVFSKTIVGWAINGVKFDPATAEVCPTQPYCSDQLDSTKTFNVEALGQTLFAAGVDGANAHIQPGGAYHYHGMPDAYLTYLGKGQNLTLVGFAVDGFPVYAKWGYTDPNDTLSAVIEMTSSYKLKTIIPTGRPDTSIVKYGTFTQDWEYQAALGHLDECNGRTSRTPEFPGGTYAYYITNTFPYIQRCVKGTSP